MLPSLKNSSQHQTRTGRQGRQIGQSQSSLWWGGKKVLLVGLGQLGGGLAMAKFLVANGAKLTVTDAKTEKDLQKSVNKLAGLKIKFSLGGHKEADFKNANVIVFNQAVSVLSPWVKLAKKLKKPFFNNLTLFFELLEVKKRNLIMITGTRGKTTTTAWIAHFLGQTIWGGNTPDSDLFEIIKKPLPENTPLILEVPSYQLEFVARKMKAPKIALITNLYNDHLNRYGDMQTYARMKANIFLNQTKNDFLILNYDDMWTKYFLGKKFTPYRTAKGGSGSGPKSKIYYISLKNLPKKNNGFIFLDNKLFFQLEGRRVLITKIGGLADFQKYNLLGALLVSYLAGKSWPASNASQAKLASRSDAGWPSLIKKISSLPQIPFRQEIILDGKKLMVVNDSAGTSPDATVAALERFKSQKLVLLTGGTDKNLDFKGLAKKIKLILKPKNLFLLEGSATDKLIKELLKNKYFKHQPQIFKTLEEMVLAVKKVAKKDFTVLFSPGAASFEKFKNEFDRGEQFNKFVADSF